MRLVSFYLDGYLRTELGEERQTEVSEEYCILQGEILCLSL